jgi:VanZ family protein
LLILSLSTLPEAFFGKPKAGAGRRLHHYLELVVHVVQFCVFFLLMNRALRSADRSRVAVRSGALLAVLLLSLVNESIQTLTPTRTFDLTDMAVDAVGGLVGLGLVLSRGPNSVVGHSRAGRGSP